MYPLNLFDNLNLIHSFIIPDSFSILVYFKYILYKIYFFQIFPNLKIKKKK